MWCLPRFTMLVLLYIMFTSVNTFELLLSKMLSDRISAIREKQRAHPNALWQKKSVFRDSVSRSSLARKMQEPSAREAGYIHFGNDVVSSDFSPVTSTDDYIEIEECAKFFVDAFWLRGTTLGELELNAAQRKDLDREQYRDMSERYGRLVGKRKLRSSLLIARDSDGYIEGCVGVEIAVADGSSGTVLSRCVAWRMSISTSDSTTPMFGWFCRAEGEALLLSSLSALGARKRGELRQVG
jgi:hypothetical protein